jgi:subtilase family serine protease
MRTSLKSLATLLAISVVAASYLTQPLEAAERQTLRDHVPAAAAGLRSEGRLPPNQRLHLTLGLPLQNQEGLTNLLEQIYDSKSPNFRRYLTPEEFTEQFGPTMPDYQKLIDFAKSNGLTVVGRHSNRVLLEVEASVADIERVFRVNMHSFQHPTEARKFYAPDVEPSIDLSLPVLHINGLDNFKRPHSNVKIAPVNRGGAKGTPNVGSGPGGSYRGGDFRAAYAPGVALTGTGQVVGLFQFDGYLDSDITQYETEAGLPHVPRTNVLINNFSGMPSSDTTEICLDIEMVIAMAPGLSSIIVYEANGLADGNAMLNRMATDNLAKQLSSSWSLTEDAMTIQIFQQFAAQGQSFFFASGDGGANNGYGVLSGDSPYITTVGGTILTVSGVGGAWLSETAWPFSTGGITSYPIPSWQAGINMSANQGSTAKRNVPDVSMVASGVYVVANNGGTNSGVGGTSVAAPLWAGFMALVNQRAAQIGRPPVGFLNPAFSSLRNQAGNGGPFLHDITTGNTTNGNNPNVYYAVNGYDLCTGWGTPNGATLIDALAFGAVWVDFNFPFPFGIGTFDLPYQSLALGAATVPTGGTVFIKSPGSSIETFNAPPISRAMTIIAVGGLANVDDVMEFAAAGASAVQIGTANFYDPTASVRIVDALSESIRQLGCERCRDGIGVAHV